jgi:hypothetical protein
VVEPLASVGVPSVIGESKRLLIPRRATADAADARGRERASEAIIVVDRSVVSLLYES